MWYQNVGSFGMSTSGTSVFIIIGVGSELL